MNAFNRGGCRPADSFSRRVRLLPAVIFIALTLFSRGASADTPKTLTFLTGPNGSSITLASCTFTGGFNAGAQLSGTGDLTVTVGWTDNGTPGKVSFTEPGFAFSGVIADAQGTVTGGGITLDKDQTLTNALNSGVDLVLGKGTQIAIVVAGPNRSVRFSGKLSANLPFYGETGDQAILTLPGNAELKPTGDFTLNVQGATLSGPTADVDPATHLAKGLSVAGCTLRASSMDIDLEFHPGQPKKVKIVAHNPMVSTPIPDVLAQDGAPLSVGGTDVTLEDDGTLSFTHAHLVNAQGKNDPQTISLAQPMAFAVTVSTADVTMAHGQFKSLDLTGSVTLPPDFFDNTDPTKHDNADIATHMTWDPANKFKVAITTQNAIKLRWNDFALEIPAGTQQNPSLSIDLSGATMGLAAPKVTFYLPSPFRDKSDNSKPVSIDGKDVHIDKFGFTGTATLSQPGGIDIQLLGFQTHLDSASLSFVRNSVVDGSVKCSGLTIPVWDAKLGVKVGVSSGGNVSVSLDTSQPLTVSKFGFTANLTGATVDIPATGKPKLMLTGSFAFDPPGDANSPDGMLLSKLAGAALEFKDLGIGTDGTFYLPNDNWITLPHPAHIDLGILGLEISQIGFGKDAQNGYWIGCTGGASVSEDLPISGGIDFDGLQVFAGPPIKVQVNGIHLKAAIAEIASIDGDIYFHNDQTPSYLSGDATVSLDCLSGAGGEIHFLAGSGCWYVDGGLIFQPGIPLGQTGLAIFGFNGGLGHNVVEKMTVDTTKQPPVSYSMDLAPGSGSWLLKAGVTLGTVDGFTFWGNPTLTVAWPPFSMGLHGDAYFMEPVSISPSHDRHGTLDIQYNSGTSTFQGIVGAELHLPDSQHELLRATGSIDFLLSPSAKHLWIGWNEPDPRPSYVQATIANVLDVSGGLGIDFAPDPKIGAGFYASTTVGPFTGEVDGTLNVNFNPTLTASGSVHFFGSASLDILGWDVADASAEGWLWASWASPSLTVSGKVTASAHVLIGDISDTFDFGPWTLP